MNFQDLKHIEDHKTYIDTAFRKAKKSKDPKGRIEAFSDYLIEALQKIIYSYPSIDSLPEFYAELVRTQLDYRYIKKSLGAVDGAINKLKEFKRKFVRDPGKLKQFYGRASSVIKKIKGNLDYLEEARKVMKDFPAVKTSLYTVALYGLPNVGKTTVLSELTPSEAEINTYPFTTKKIN
ncbi:MAG: GTPase, partial [Nanobdellota archaeon]